MRPPDRVPPGLEGPTPRGSDPRRSLTHCGDARGRFGGKVRPRLEDRLHAFEHPRTLAETRADAEEPALRARSSGLTIEFFVGGSQCTVDRLKPSEQPATQVAGVRPDCQTIDGAHCLALPPVHDTVAQRAFSAFKAVREREPDEQSAGELTTNRLAPMERLFEQFHRRRISGINADGVMGPDPDRCPILREQPHEVRRGAVRADVRGCRVSNDPCRRAQPDRVGPERGQKIARRMLLAGEPTGDRNLGLVDECRAGGGGLVGGERPRDLQDHQVMTGTH